MWRERFPLPPERSSSCVCIWPPTAPMVIAWCGIARIGSPMTNPDDNEALQAAPVQAGIDRPAATTHWLRHSYTTLADHAGIPHAAYAGVSGHSSEQASDPYRHALTAEGRLAVVTLSEWLNS